MIIVLQHLLKSFSWSTIAIVRDKDPLYSSLVDVMTSLNENAKEKLTITVHNLFSVTSMDDGVLLKEIKNHARSKSDRDQISYASLRLSSETLVYVDRQTNNAGCLQSSYC